MQACVVPLSAVQRWLHRYSGESLLSSTLVGPDIFIPEYPDCTRLCCVIQHLSGKAKHVYVGVSGIYVCAKEEVQVRSRILAPVASGLTSRNTRFFGL